MLPQHAREVDKLIAEYKKLGETLSAAVRRAYPIGAEFELRRAHRGGGSIVIKGKVIEYSPSNPKEVWFIWLEPPRTRGRNDRFQAGHDEAKITKYAL